MMVGWMCLTSHRQRGHSETAPPLTVPSEGREAQFLHRPHRESNSRSVRGSPLHNRCKTPSPQPVMMRPQDMTPTMSHYTDMTTGQTCHCAFHHYAEHQAKHQNYRSLSLWFDLTEE